MLLKILRLTEKIPYNLLFSLFTECGQYRADLKRVKLEISNVFFSNWVDFK